MITQENGYAYTQEKRARVLYPSPNPWAMTKLPYFSLLEYRGHQEHYL